MAFTFAAPNGVHYEDASVKQVDVPSFSGNFGILPNHVPALAVLSPGVVTVYEDDGGAKKFFVSSGSITVNEDSSVQILAEEAHAVASLDINEAKAALSEAQSSAASATTDVAKAEAQIAVEVAEEIVKACTA
jgi:F-type H+-transporting ATPase subunit delta